MHLHQFHQVRPAIRRRMLTSPQTKLFSKFPGDHGAGPPLVHIQGNRAGHGAVRAMGGSVSVSVSISIRAGNGGGGTNVRQIVVFQADRAQPFFMCALRNLVRIVKKVGVKVAACVSDEG